MELQHVTKQKYFGGATCGDISVSMVFKSCDPSLSRASKKQISSKTVKLKSPRLCHPKVILHNNRQTTLKKMHRKIAEGSKYDLNYRVKVEYVHSLKPLNIHNIYLISKKKKKPPFWFPLLSPTFLSTPAKEKKSSSRVAALSCLYKYISKNAAACNKNPSQT